MIRIVGFYRWQDGAHFDHTYYHSEHMHIARDALSPHGLMRLESDRFLSQAAPVPGQIIAATYAYFPSFEVAQAALIAGVKTLIDDVSKYTNLMPEIHLSEVYSHA